MVRRDRHTRRFRSIPRLPAGKSYPGQDSNALANLLAARRSVPEWSSAMTDCISPLGYHLLSSVLRQNSMRTENSASFLPRSPPHPGHPFTLERQESVPGNPSARYMCIYKDGGTRTFTTRRWFGLGSPIVPVVQPSQSRMRKDVTGGYGASSSVWRSLP
jgi:hypothetical protein